MASATVLYIEDDENDLFFMEMAFRGAGLTGTLRSARNGQEAIDYLAGTGPYGNRERHPLPRVVLLDLKLPVVPGFEVLGWLRGQPHTKELPVVVFSSSSREADKKQARELGANDYWEKPNSALLFRDVVEGLKARWLAPPSSPGSETS